MARASTPVVSCEAARARIPSAPASPPHIARQWPLPAKPASNAAVSVTAPASMGSLFGPCRLFGRRLRLLFAQYVPGWRLEIVELAGAHRPEERPAGEHHQHQRYGYENEQDTHGATPPFTVRRGSRRVAFSTTAIELSDIPSAATQGGMKPSAASGSEPKL